MAILTTDQVMEKYSITKQTAIRIFSSHNSPAFKIGNGRGHWRVDENKFENFLLKRSEKSKG